MNDSTQPARPSWIERAFNNPTVGMVGWAATVLGFLLAFYFYFASRETPDLTYFVSPNRTSIVATGDTPGIAITYKGRELSKNVSAAQIVLWNAGKKPIRHDDVLTPYVITVQGGHPIVTAKIVAVTNPVIEFRLNETNSQAGQLGIDWRVLERNDGAIVQVIYEGDTSVPIELNGVSIGQRAIGKRTQIDSFKTNKERSTWDKVEVYITPTLNAAFILFILLGAYIDVAGFRKKRWHGIKTGQWIGLAFKVALGAALFGISLNRFQALF